MFSYDTVTEALSDLKKRNFNLDFNLLENCIICNEQKFDIDDFEIKEFYRFEGDSDPADQAIVYAIESKTARPDDPVGRGLKGVLVSGYGISAEGMSAELAKKLQVHKTL